MKKFLILVMILFGSTAVFADIAPPKTPKPTATPKPAKAIDSFMTIRFNEGYKEPKLLIPRKQLKQLRAEIDQLDDAESNTAAVTDTQNTQTIISGAFLSLAMIFGGVWLTRSRTPRATKGVIGVILAIILAASSGYLYGNAGPPTEARSITSKMFNMNVMYYHFGSGKVKVEVTDAESIELQVPLIKETPKPSPSNEE